MRVYMLLDRSGSMSALMEEALGSINEYVKNLSASTNVVLASFDDTSYDIVRNTTANGWTDVKPNEVTPRGMTPLYDSAAKLLDLAFKENPEKAYFVVMTDGHENASREYTQAAIKAKLAKAEAKNWEVIFLGANFDAVTHVSTSLGLGLEKSINIVGGNLKFEMANLATSTMAYATAGTRTMYTQEDRTRAAKKS